MNEIEIHLIVVEAEFKMLSIENGGRERPVKTGYNPNHKFDTKNYYMGRIKFGDDEWHLPGETNYVTIEFIESPGLRDKLVEGFTWDVTEGAHKIGVAKIISVIDEIKYKVNPQKSF